MARYWIGTTSNSWGDTANWSDTSGGATGFSVPTNADDVIFDGNGNNPCSLDTTNKQCLSFTVQGTYTNTITHDIRLDVTSSVTLHTGYTIAGTGALHLGATCTFTSGGKTWPNTLNIDNSTVTLVGDLTVDGSVSGDSTTVNWTTNEKLICNGGIDTTGNFSGTADLYIKGGTWSSTGAVSNRRFSINAFIDGNVTIASSLVFGGNSKTLKYVSGTVTVTGSTLSIYGDCNLDTNGMSWENVTFANVIGNFTATLLSNFSLNGLFTSSQGSLQATTSETITCAGGIAINSSFSGTAKFILTGGTWSGSNTSGIGNNLDLQGNVTIDTNVYYRLGTLTYVSGTITVAGSTLNITDTCTLNTDSVGWNNFKITAGSITITLTSNLTVNGLFSCTNGSNTITFNKTTSETATLNGGYSSDTGSLTGTAKLVFVSGTFTCGGRVSCNVDVQGTLTFDNFVFGGGATMTYVSGTVTTTGSTFTFNDCTLNVSGITWDNITLSGTLAVVTLTSNLVCTGTYLHSNGTGINHTTSETITCGSLSIQTNNDIGTAKIIITNGTWSTVSGAFGWACDIDLQGTVAIVGNVYKRGGTISYVSGTITTTGSTLNIVQSSTLNTPPANVIWEGITIGGSSTVTVTLASNVQMTSVFTISNLVVLNSTVSETWTTSGGIAVSAGCSGTAKVILTGGTWSALNSNSHISNNVDLQGNITISGNVYYRNGTLRYVSGSITTTGSTLNLANTLSLDTSTVSWNNVVSGTSTNTVTLISNFLVGGTTTISTSTTINSTVSETWTTNSLTVNNTLSGTAKIILTEGTWSGSNTTGISNNLDLQGNVTVSGNVYYRTGTLQYVSGTITVTSSTLNITASCTLDTDGMSWNNVTLITASSTFTLTSNFLMGGLFSTQTNRNPTINRTTTETFTIGGGVTMGTNTTMSGTAEVIVTGGTVNATNGNVQSNFTFAGTVSLSGTNFIYNGGTLKYSSGTVTVGSTNLLINGSCTLDTNGIIWGTVSHGNTNNMTFTINSLFTANTWTLNTASSYTFTGTHGFNLGTLASDAIGVQTVTLQDLITYTITSAFNCYKSRIGAIVLLTSSHASNRANILMPNNGNNICNVLVSFTRIDASGGRSICTFGGTVTDCLNVVSYTDYPPIAA